MKSSKETNSYNLSNIELFNIVKKVYNIEFNIIESGKLESAYEQIKKDSTTKK